MDTASAAVDGDDAIVAEPLSAALMLLLLLPLKNCSIVLRFSAYSRWRVVSSTSWSTTWSPPKVFGTGRAGRIGHSKARSSSSRSSRVRLFFDLEELVVVESARLNCRDDDLTADELLLLLKKVGLSEKRLCSVTAESVPSERYWCRSLKTLLDRPASLLLPPLELLLLLLILDEGERWEVVVVKEKGEEEEVGTAGGGGSLCSTKGWG